MSASKTFLIFDMDGLLVDSEPWWKVAEKEVFGSLGLSLTDELLRQVMGFRLNEVVAHWYRYQAWEGMSFEEVEYRIIEVMKRLLQENAVALPGVREVLDFAASRNIPMAVASSSNMSLIETVVDKLQIHSYFDLLCSAETERFGKPHPDIFIHTAQKAGYDVNDCIVFEDSVNGVIAAKAARMTCIAIPEKEKVQDPRFSIADYRFSQIDACLPMLHQRLS